MKRFPNTYVIISAIILLCALATFFVPAGQYVTSPDGTVTYHMSPEVFAEHMKKLMEAGACIVGGCCGTTPEYIRQLAGLV